MEFIGGHKSFREGDVESYNFLPILKISIPGRWRKVRFKVHQSSTQTLKVHLLEDVPRTSIVHISCTTHHKKYWERDIKRKLHHGQRIWDENITQIINDKKTSCLEHLALNTD